MDTSNKNLDALIKCIRSCGISFNVWEKAEEDCRGGLYDFTSLMVSDKQLLLKTLPRKPATILPDNTSGTIVGLWQVLIGHSLSVSVSELLEYMRYMMYHMYTFIM